VVLWLAVVVLWLAVVVLWLAVVVPCEAVVAPWEAVVGPWEAVVGPWEAAAALGAPPPPAGLDGAAAFGAGADPCLSAPHTEPAASSTTMDNFRYPVEEALRTINLLILQISLSFTSPAATAA
jgi:hypothetical protein